MYYLLNLVVIFFWVVVGNCIGKYKILFVIIILLSFWSVWLLFVLIEWMWVFFVLMMFKGVCSMGLIFFLLILMMVDVIDVDMLRFGE